MLRVEYEATDELQPGRLADISEGRGHVRVRVRRPAPLADIVRQLNVEIERLLSHWFQLWKGEIISHGTPDRSLGIVYLLDLRELSGVVVRERRGLVTVHIDPALTAEEFAAAMNAASAEFLKGGQWFQMYAGEIIDNSPEPMSQV